MAAGLFVGGYFVGSGSESDAADAVPSDERDSNARILDALTTNEQIVLTSVAAESISESTEYSTFNDYEIFGTGRTVYLQFTFTAQLGFDGMGVVAEEAGPGEYVVTVPEFAVIDHDDLEVQALAENNGVLGVDHARGRHHRTHRGIQGQRFARRLCR